MMKTNTWINPHLAYTVSFSAGIATYGLQWSDLYPSLKLSLLSFLGITIVLHLLAGFYLNRNLPVFNTIVSEKLKWPLLITLGIYTLWLLDFLHAGTVPLYSIVFNIPYNYRTFGVPSLHVFTVTFSSFYTVYLFHLYLSNKNKYILLLYFMNLFAALLIFNRGMFIFNLSSSLFVYILLNPRVKWSRLLLVLLCIPLLIYFFGVLGTLRVSREAKRPYTNDLFLATGKASENFKRSYVPKELFWGYIYVTSPIANLQTNINERSLPAMDGRSLMNMINNELLFDFISKRINALIDYSDVKDHRITVPFNASTIYSKSFSYLGWYGMWLMSLVLLVIPGIYMKLHGNDSPYLLSGMAILCTIYCFSAFDNTWRFTGLSFQLVYPLIFSWVGRFRNTKSQP